MTLRNRVFFHDCRTMGEIPDASVNCCVTSPPYWGLRSYHGGEAMIGLEQSPQAWVDNLIAVFREVKRVLRDDGTLWVNVGDCYAGNPKGSLLGQDKSGLTSTLTQENGVPLALNKIAASGLKPKDLVGLPWMLAFALRSDGWYLRSDIIWHKPNPMPASVTDRPTSAHEYVFLLSKSKRYYYDADAIREPLAESSVARLTQPNLEAQAGSDRANAGGKTNGPMKAVAAGPRIGPKGSAGDNATYSGNAWEPRRKGRTNPRPATPANPDANEGIDERWSWSNRQFVGANKRDVWTVATEGYTGAHFAVYPPDLIRPCILAGSAPDGVVLDPFMGSGTTARVALECGRDFIGYEIAKEYEPLIAERLGMFYESASV